MTSIRKFVGPDMVAGSGTVALVSLLVADPLLTGRDLCASVQMLVSR